MLGRGGLRSEQGPGRGRVWGLRLFPPLGPGLQLGLRLSLQIGLGVELGPGPGPGLRLSPGGAKGALQTQAPRRPLDTELVARCHSVTQQWRRPGQYQAQAAPKQLPPPRCPPELASEGQAARNVTLIAQVVRVDDLASGSEQLGRLQRCVLKYVTCRLRGAVILIQATSPARPESNLPQQKSAPWRAA